MLSPKILMKIYPTTKARWFCFMFPHKLTQCVSASEFPI